MSGFISIIKVIVKFVIRNIHNVDHIRGDDDGDDADIRQYLYQKLPTRLIQTIKFIFLLTKEKKFKFSHCGSGAAKVKATANSTKRMAPIMYCSRKFLIIEKINSVIAVNIYSHSS